MNKVNSKTFDFHFKFLHKNRMVAQRFFAIKWKN